MSSGSHEVEIKLAVPDARAARRFLRRAGFRVSKRRVFEANEVFDTTGLALRSSGTLLRLRQAGKQTTLTYKGAAQPGVHKIREEIETDAGGLEPMTAILGRLGFEPVFRYEKYRTEYREPRGGGVAMVDETPIGVFLELEGSPRWIDRTARRLGFAKSDYSTASYGRLYLDWCAQRGVEPKDMVFGRRAPQR